ncbi:universal stress protein [Aspergillus ruber CBS 135680]|uniref:Adenine nucleotide alpha hydrolases-like protein n=1 Tax=Aspergillus ruber (strain CBS 135680) TaxID=1388766 RepID=A0A017SH56_ASPRC|nr:adenine nucleotide alpha hydrolases-like protein [Aspergillus ruber CBS 135680]EYE95610.1 adenine nucleotide alpha hydrolases-like protein [Aspergillus ruber CBS 135680]
MSRVSSPRGSFESDNDASRPNKRISYADEAPRRKSIQFSFGGGFENRHHRRSSSDKGPGEKSLKRSHIEFQDREREKEREREQKQSVIPPSASRGPSPPPPNTYERGVSFDTFDNPDAADFSLTLNYKHKGYQCTRRSRTFLCGTDQNEYSDFALEWLIDELVDDGDEIVCLRAVENASDAGMEPGRYRKEAEKLFEQVIQKNSQDEKAISLVLELAVGKVQDIIQRMIRIYEPAVLIVGTRGRNLSGMQSLLPGSVSKYCLQQSPIPVIVVRPSTKREKKKKKRLADPSRRSYNHILELSERRGSHIFDPSSSTDSSVARLPDEEAAVAKALGLPAAYANSRGSLSSGRSSVDDLISPMLEVTMKSSSGESLECSGHEKFEDARQSQKLEDDETAPVDGDSTSAFTERGSALSPTTTDVDSGPVSETTDKPSNIQVVITDGTETK